jgi:hypothetical protein
MFASAFDRRVSILLHPQVMKNIPENFGENLRDRARDPAHASAEMYTNTSSDHRGPESDSCMHYKDEQRSCKTAYGHDDCARVVNAMTGHARADEIVDFT